MSRNEKEAPAGYYAYVGNQSTATGGAVWLNIGSNLKEARNRAGLTLEEAAKHVDISLSTLSRIERGQAEPTYRQILNLCSAYECDALAVLGLANDEERELLRIYEYSSQTMQQTLLELARNLFKSKALQESRYPAPDPKLNAELYNRDGYPRTAKG